MANPLRTRKFLRSMVRARIDEPFEDAFKDQELNGIIDFAQYEVARRLSNIEQEWFAKKYTIGLSAGVNIYDLPSDILEIRSIIWYKDVRKLPLSKVGLINSNSNYTPSTENAFWWQEATKLHFRPTPGSGDIEGVYADLTIWGIQRPTPLAADETETILREEFLEALIRYCVMICAPKKPHLSAADAEKKYDEYFLEMEKKYRVPVDHPTPGEGKA